MRLEKLRECDFSVLEKAQASRIGSDLKLMKEYSVSITLLFRKWQKSWTTPTGVQTPDCPFHSSLYCPAILFVHSVVAVVVPLIVSCIETASSHPPIDSALFAI